jgi:hypothetical protein
VSNAARDDRDDGLVVDVNDDVCHAHVRLESLDGDDACAMKVNSSTRAHSWKRAAECEISDLLKVHKYEISRRREHRDTLCYRLHL